MRPGPVFRTGILAHPPAPAGRPDGLLDVYSHVTPSMHDEAANTMDRLLAGG
jgi:hypothetical protein